MRQLVTVIICTSVVMGAMALPQYDPNNNEIWPLHEYTVATTHRPQNIARGKDCTTNEDHRGTCVPLSLCSGDNKVEDPIDFTYRSGGCSHYYEVCCPPDRLLGMPKKSPPPANKGCGWSNPGANVLRDGGDSTKRSGRADFGDFPWMVAIIKKSQNNRWRQGDYLGGGSLIHPSVVMTAAHKVDNFDSNELKCRAGEWDTQSESELWPHQERDVVDIIIHEDFMSKTDVNDVALLILKSPFELGPHIGIACLGKSSRSPGTICYSMGWGAQNFNNKDQYSVTLKKITLPLVDREVCENWLRNTQLGSGYRLFPSLTCAGGEENVDTCEGDGGSSLVCAIGKTDLTPRYEIYGMVAYGVRGCGLKNVPGVYVNVPKVYSWINMKMMELNYEIMYNP